MEKRHRLLPTGKAGLRLARSFPMDDALSSRTARPHLPCQPDVDAPWSVNDVHWNYWARTLRAVHSAGRWDRGGGEDSFRAKHVRCAVVPGQKVAGFRSRRLR